MAQWHRPTQVALIIKKIQLDTSIKDLYEYEYNLGWTDCINIWTYWTCTKDRIIKLTGNSVYQYIKSNTINYRNIIIERKAYINNMTKKSKLTPQQQDNKQKAL